MARYHYTGYFRLGYFKFISVILKYASFDTFEPSNGFEFPARAPQF